MLGHAHALHTLCKESFLRDGGTGEAGQTAQGRSEGGYEGLRSIGERTGAFVQCYRVLGAPKALRTLRETVPLREMPTPPRRLGTG